MRIKKKLIAEIRRGHKSLPAACLVVLAALAASDGEARRMSEPEVRAAAQTWARNTTPDARPDAVVESMEPYEVGGGITAYVARLSGGGFCLCGLDEILLPVYFYSPRGTFDPENPGLQCILSQMTERALMVREWERIGDPRLDDLRLAAAGRPRIWSDLIAGVAPEREVQAPEGTTLEPSMMELPLNSDWHQFHPYNDQCPVHPDGSGEHTLVGCPATAFSQIMYYWKWPNTGSGSSSVYYPTRKWPAGTWDSTPLASDPLITDSGDWSWSGRLAYLSSTHRLYISGCWDWSIHGAAHNDSSLVQNITPEYLTALQTLYERMPADSTLHAINYAAASYTWSLIQNSHDDPPDAGDTEVAKINYHTAVAVNTNFGLRGSSASCPLVVEGATAHLRYDTDAATQATNISTMTSEIAWLRPLGIGGCGHMWVVCGYDKSTDPNRSFKVNMGWRGTSSDGWELLDFHCPASGMEHATMLAPKDVVKFVGGYLGGDGTPNSPYRNIETAVAGAPSGATLIFKAGSDNLFTATTLVIDKPLTLKGTNVVIRR
ncbi:MAG: C10 family peptidase [Candidatus Krumholzibacteria bacterium]|nr:C10 family peptidase [Candidatus Krumholzibacteria bacterium]